MTVSQLATAISGLRLAWFREQCEKVMDERIARSGPVAGIDHCLRARDPERRLARLEASLEILRDD